MGANLEMIRGQVRNGTRHKVVAKILIWSLKTAFGKEQHSGPGEKMNWELGERGSDVVMGGTY